jgi:predicted  nucleic acid-binding Zn-ribbon protein
MNGSLLPQKVVDEYEAMKLSAGGIAIAECSEGTCSACHFQIRPQILVQLQARRSLNLCENYGRILWIAKES